MLRFQIKYFVLFLLLLVTEILIALYAHDRFIRPYFGDFLVVMLVYCFVKSFLSTPVIATGIAVLLFAYAIEVGQYFHLADALGLQPHSAWRMMIGSSFEWSDMVAYTLGVLFIILIEKKWNRTD